MGVLNWIQFGQENWADLVPEADFSTWKINPSRFDVPKPKPKDSARTRTLRYFVRRFRNALGHGNVKVNVPTGATLPTMMTDITISIHDEDPKDRPDTFDVELTLKDAYEVLRILQQIIHTDVAKRHGVTAPQMKP